MSGENTQTTPEDMTEMNPEGPVASDTQSFETAEATLEADAQGFAGDDATEARIAELQKELEDMKSKWMRAVAEEQNVRRRAEREKQDALKYGMTSFAREMVSVADNLRRALGVAGEELKGSDFLTGVEMTERELQNVFSKAGIKRVEAQGKPFDHNYHQAVFEIQDPSQPAGLVGQVMQDGYVIHDRLLRPAMVGVTKGGPKYEGPLKETASSQGEEIQANDAYEKAGAESGMNFDQET